MEVEHSIKGSPMVLFWRLQGPDLYHELFVWGIGWSGWIKTAKDRWVSIPIAYENPTFAAEEFGFWTRTTPRERKTIKLVDLCKPTYINCEKGDETFLYWFAIVRSYARCDAIRRCQVQRITTRPTAVRDISLGHAWWWSWKINFQTPSFGSTLIRVLTKKQIQWGTATTRA